MLKNNAILKLPSLWTHQTSPQSPHFNPSMSSSASLSRHHKNWTISAFGRGTDPVCPISIGPRRPGITVRGTWANVSLLFTRNLQTGTRERAQETCKGWCLHQAAQVKLAGACLSVCLSLHVHRQEAVRFSTKAGGIQADLNPQSDFQQAGIDTQSTSHACKCILGSQVARVLIYIQLMALSALRKIHS